MRAASLITIVFTCMRMGFAHPVLGSRRLQALNAAQQAIDDDHLPELERAILPNNISEIDELQAERDDGTHADFIVVGSGAGGGPVAARLAESGFSVLLLEAGKQKTKLVTQVPGFVFRAQEDEELVWNYWVQHLDPKQEQTLQDGFHFLANQHAAAEKPFADLYSHSPKTFRNCTTTGCRDESFSNMDTKSVLYPRGSAVGGSTVINNNIAMMAPDSEWNRLASLVGDETWSAPYMRSLLQEIEDNHYVRGPLSSLLQLVPNGGVQIEDQHGYADDGGSKHWLHTDHLDVSSVLLGGIGASASFLLNLFDWGLLQGIARHLVRGLYNAGDANSQPAAVGQTGGVVLPTQVYKGKRFSVRNRIDDVRREKKSMLKLLTDTFVRRVVFQSERAIGVEVDHGEYLHSASPKFDPTRRPSAQRIYKARHEVIISAGAFETPKLLAFSGIGPDAHHRHDPNQHVVISDNVGANLQDRVEMSVITSFDEKWKLYEECTFLSEGLASKDPCWQRYMAAGFEDDSTSEARNGAYGIGILLGDFGHGLTDPAASQSQRFKLTQRPDIFYFSGPVFFEGYRPGYGFSAINSDSRHYTFVGLEAYTESSGHVRVESGNPFQQPAINFRKFSDPNGRDMQRAKTMFRRLREDAHSINAPEKEVSPGLDRVPLQYTEKQLEDHILTSAWGHHCCCTASMGRTSTSALDSKFRVRNSASSSGFVDGLRVVDASIWPEIPGYFPMLPLILASEKAAMDIITDHSRSPSRARWFCLQKIECINNWRPLPCGNLRITMRNGRRQDLLSFPSTRVISGEPCLNAFPYFESAGFDLIEKGAVLDHRVTTLAVSTGEGFVEKEFDGWGGWLAPTYKVAYKVLA